MVRSELTADASLAAMRDRSRFGMAIAAMIRMIATTISNSISEKPFFLIRQSSYFESAFFVNFFRARLSNPHDLSWRNFDTKCDYGSTLLETRRLVDA